MNWIGSRKNLENRKTVSLSFLMMKVGLKWNLIFILKKPFKKIEKERILFLAHHFFKRWKNVSKQVTQKYHIYAGSSVGILLNI